MRRPGAFKAYANPEKQTHRQEASGEGRRREERQRQRREKSGLKDPKGGCWGISSGSFTAFRMTAGTGNGKSNSNSKGNCESYGLKASRGGWGFLRGPSLRSG
jgi:hypothetical protein